MVGGGLVQQRPFYFAALDGFRAARVEPAAGRPRDQAGLNPFQNDALALIAWIQHQDGVHRRLGLQMARIAEQLASRRRLRQLAQINHAHAVGNVLHHADVVRHKQ